MAISTKLKVISKKELEWLSLEVTPTSEQRHRQLAIEIIQKIDFEELKKVFKFGFQEDKEYVRYSATLETKD